MTITKIYGFNREAQTLFSQDLQLKVTEEVLVEADTPDLNLASVVDFLPNLFSGPGTVAFNPDRLTFTLFQSRHPYSNKYYLESLNSMRRAPNGDHFWIINLTFSTPAPSPIPPAASGGAKRQRVKKADSPDKKKQVPITNPMERPPEWDGVAKVVMVNRFHDLENKVIRHTNGLPISKPLPFPMVTNIWTWSWNVAVADFPGVQADCDELTSRVNVGAFSIEVGHGGSKSIAASELKCAGFSYSEEFETPNGTETEYHYVRITGTFEYTEGFKWDTPPLSQHTKEYNIDSTALQDIVINERGDKAKEPWPLDRFGKGVPYGSIDGYDEDFFGKLQAGGGDLRMLRQADIHSFFTTHSLKLPFIDD